MLTGQGASVLNCWLVEAGPGYQVVTLMAWGERMLPTASFTLGTLWCRVRGRPPRRRPQDPRGPLQHCRGERETGRMEPEPVGMGLEEGLAV